MQECNICGNEIQERVKTCPFCGAQQEVISVIEKKVAVRVSIVKLKENNPTVDEAMQRLSNEILAARKRNIKVIKIIHGYGSSGRLASGYARRRWWYARHGRHDVKKPLAPRMEAFSASDGSL